MKILVSACLLGDNCKYNGGNNYSCDVVDYVKDKECVKVCPECMGGLSTPRVPSEIVGNKVINKNGLDVTYEYQKGAKETLKIALDEKVDLAILKSNSPSCGCGKIYDGTFSKRLVDGDGITTKLLKEHDIKIITENELKTEVKS